MNPFGDAPVGEGSQNPFGDEVVANPFGDSEVKKEPFSFTNTATKTVTALGKEIHDLPSTVTNAAKFLGKSVTQGSLQLGEAASAGSELLTDVTKPILPDSVYNPVYKAASDNTEYFKRKEQELQTDGGLVAEGIQSGIASDVSQLPGVAAALAKGSSAPGLAWAAATQGLPAYHEARQQGKDVLGALGYGSVQGGTEALFESFGLGYLVNNLGKVGLGKMVSHYLGREIPSELATTISQNAEEQAYLNPEKTLGDYVTQLKHDLPVTAIATITGGGLTAGVAHTITGDRRPVELNGGNTEDTPPVSPTETPPTTADTTPAAETPVLPTVKHPDADPMLLELDQILSAQVKVDQASAQVKQTPLTEEQLAQADALAVTPAETKVRIPTAEGTSAFGQIDQLDSKVDTAELGASRKVAGNEPNYAANPNDTLPRTQREITIGLPGQVGKTLVEIPKQPGTITIGQPSTDRSSEFMQTYHDVVEKIRQKYMPNATIVLTNESLPTNYALGWHSQLDSGVHVITPGFLRDSSRSSDERNANSQVKVWYNLNHEIGHAILSERLGEGLAPEVAHAIFTQSEVGPVDLSLTQGMSSEAQGMIGEYNALRERVTSGQMAAQQFMQEWMSPWKLGQTLKKEPGLGKGYLQDLGIAPTANAMDLIRAMAFRSVVGAKETTTNGAEYAAAVQREMNTILSLQEYAAEQSARLAYSDKTHIGTGFNTKAFFHRALQTLRKVFRDLKAEKVIKPGVKFEEWMASLTKTDQVLADKAKIAAVATQMKEGKAAKKKEAKKKEVVKPEKQASEDLRGAYRGVLNRLAAEGTLEVGSSEYKMFKEMIAEGQWAELRESFENILGTKLKFEKDYAVKAVKELGFTQVTEEEAQTPAVMAEALKEWLAKGTRSRYFKAFFGDWENNAQSASKVVTADGQPLPVYHMTTAAAHMPYVGKDSTMAFDQFSRGDIGFHAGTVFAAHVRGYKAESMFGVPTEGHLNAKQDWVHKELTKAEPGTDWGDKIISKYGQMNLLKLYMNIRNPLDLGNERTEFWNQPTEAIRALADLGVATEQEASDLLGVLLRNNKELDRRVYQGGQPSTMREIFQPIRAFLQSKGYDGLKYNNTVEGDVSWVAFEPEQIKADLGHKTFSRSPKIHWEKTFDESTPDGSEMSKAVSTVERFSPGKGLRMAGRAVLSGQYCMLQLQQLAHIHPDNESLGFISDMMRRYNQAKGKLTSAPDMIAQKWKWLGKEDNAKVAKFLNGENQAGVHWVEQDANGKFIGGENFVNKLMEYGIDPSTEEGKKMAQIILDTKNSLDEHIVELERALTIAIGLQHANAQSLVLQAALQRTFMQIAEIRKTPFFPQAWFGKYAVVVRKKSTKGPGYEVVHKESFEHEDEQIKRHAELARKAKSDELVERKELTDTEFVLAQLPKDLLALMAVELGLREDQQIRLSELMGSVNSNKVLDQFDKKRLKITGSSDDALRCFVNFTWHNANFVAKLEYGRKMDMAIRGMRAEIKNLGLVPGEEAAKKQRDMRLAAEFAQKAKDYAFAPPNEWQTFRTWVTLGYLWANIKSAVLNLAGMSNVLAYALTERKLGGASLFTKAAATTVGQLFGKVSPLEEKLLDRGMQEGITAQSYAYHLAGIATGGNLHRLYNRSALSRYAHGALDLGMLAFKLVEQFNRRTTLLVAYEIAQEKLAQQDKLFERNPDEINEEAFQEAARLTDLLQGDYTSGNRAPFMRGDTRLGPLLPLATVFMTFTQMMVFHAYGGFELGNRRADALVGRKAPSALNSYTFKVMLMLFLMAGYEGLPGAENILDMLDALWRKLYGTNARQDIREFMKGQGQDPGFWAHGFGHDVRGFDISGSLGVGRLVPGVDTLTFPGGTLDSTIGKSTMDLFGATGGFVRALLDGKLDHLPGEVGNISAALKWSKEGVTDSRGAKITFGPDGKLRELDTGEIVGKALGFNPTIVSENREINFDKFSQETYWQTRRQDLKKQVWEAIRLGDREAIKDTKQAILDFNSEVKKTPETRPLAISGKELGMYIQGNKKAVRTLEHGKPLNRRFGKLEASIEQSYSESE